MLTLLCNHPAGLGTDEGLRQLAAAPIQATGLEELQQHLPAVGDAARVEHSRQCGRGRVACLVSRRDGQGDCQVQVLSQ